MKENKNSKKELNEKDTQNVSGGEHVYTTKGNCDFCGKEHCCIMETVSHNYACLRCYSKICKLNEKYHKDI